MSDSKVSGLPAVAAFVTTQEFPVNDSGTSRKITGAQIIAALPQGTLPGGYQQIVANQTLITAQVDVTGLAATVTLLAGRRIRITADMWVASSVANDVCRLFLMQGVTQLNQAEIVVPTTATTPTLRVSVVFVSTAGTFTYKVQAARVGTGNMTVFGSATGPGSITVEDIGV